VVLTYSRGAYVALVVMLVAAVVAGYIRLKTLVIGVAIFAMIVPILPGSYASRLTSLYTIAVTPVRGNGNSTADSSDSSYTGRTVQMMAGVNMFVDYPALGVGAQNYPEYYQEYARPLGTTRRMNRTPHNLYLEIAAETGALGLATFSIVTVALLLWMRRVWRSVTQPPELRDLARAAAVAMTGYLAGSMFLHNAYPRYWWIVVSVVLVTVVVADERRRLRPAVRMKSIKRLNPLAEQRLRQRLRIASGGVGIVILALVTVLAVDARFQSAGLRFLPRGGDVETASSVRYTPVFPSSETGITGR
jgi:O-antigen ligase